MATPAPTTTPRRPPASRRRERQLSVPAIAAISLGIAGTLILTFVAYLYGASTLQQHRSQDTMYGALRPQLANALAPIGGPIALGTPIAILTVPAIGVRQVVVEGTRSDELMKGPGHRRDTAFPGQAGVSLVMGRRGTFGAPFAHLNQLRTGDAAVVTTGQGNSVYLVADVRHSDKPSRPLIGANRLVLVTADSAFRPSGTIVVTLLMKGNPFPTAGQLSRITPSESALAGDTSAALLLVLWGQALLLGLAGTVYCYQQFGRWPTYLAAMPVLLAILWNVFEALARFLPNVM
jgi:sortase A